MKVRRSIFAFRVAVSYHVISLKLGNVTLVYLGNHVQYGLDGFGRHDADGEVAQGTEAELGSVVAGTKDM